MIKAFYAVVANNIWFLRECRCHGIVGVLHWKIFNSTVALLPKLGVVHRMAMVFV